MIDGAAISKAREDPAFGDDGWLTFYLAGNPCQHAAMRSGLESLNAVNLDGAESGFIYAKLPVPLEVEQIAQRIAQVRKLAEKAEVRIDVIDLDASADVQGSKFYTLWTANGPT